MSVVHIYPYFPQCTEAGPMNYSHCGSNFGQWSPLSEHNEFDKAARVQITSTLIWSRGSFKCKWVKRGLSPEHRSLLEQSHWIQKAEPGPGCTRWTSPERVGQQEQGGSCDLSLACPLKAAWDGRRSARSEHSCTMKYDRVTEYLTWLKQECSD